VPSCITLCYGDLLEDLPFFSNPREDLCSDRTRQVLDNNLECFYFQGSQCGRDPNFCRLGNSDSKENFCAEQGGSCPFYALSHDLRDPQSVETCTHPDILAFDQYIKCRCSPGSDLARGGGLGATDELCSDPNYLRDNFPTRGSAGAALDILPGGNEFEGDPEFEEFEDYEPEFEEEDESGENEDTEFVEHEDPEFEELLEDESVEYEDPENENEFEEIEELTEASENGGDGIETNGGSMTGASQALADLSDQRTSLSDQNTPASGSGSLTGISQELGELSEQRTE